MLTIHRFLNPITLAIALCGFAAGILKAEDHLVLNLWGGTVAQPVFNDERGAMLMVLKLQEGRIVGGLGLEAWSSDHQIRSPRVGHLEIHRQSRDGQEWEVEVALVRSIRFNDPRDGESGRWILRLQIDGERITGSHQGTVDGFGRNPATGAAVAGPIDGLVISAGLAGREQIHDLHLFNARSSEWGDVGTLRNIGTFDFAQVRTAPDGTALDASAQPMQVTVAGLAGTALVERAVGGVPVGEVDDLQAKPENLRQEGDRLHGTLLLTDRNKQHSIAIDLQYLGPVGIGFGRYVLDPDEPPPRRAKPGRATPFPVWALRRSPGTTLFAPPALSSQVASLPPATDQRDLIARAAEEAGQSLFPGTPGLEGQPMEPGRTRHWVHYTQAIPRTIHPPTELFDDQVGGDFHLQVRQGNQVVAEARGNDTAELIRQLWPRAPAGQTLTWSLHRGEEELARADRMRMPSFQGAPCGIPDDIPQRVLAHTRWLMQRSPYAPALRFQGSAAFLRQGGVKSQANPPHIAYGLTIGHALLANLSEDPGEVHHARMAARMGAEWLRLQSIFPQRSTEHYKSLLHFTFWNGLTWSDFLRMADRNEDQELARSFLRAYGGLLEFHQAGWDADSRELLGRPSGTWSFTHWLPDGPQKAEQRFRRHDIPTSLWYAEGTRRFYWGRTTYHVDGVEARSPFEYQRLLGKTEWDAGEFLYLLGRMRRLHGIDDFIEVERRALDWHLRFPLRTLIFDSRGSDNRGYMHSGSAMYLALYLLEGPLPGLLPEADRLPLARRLIDHCENLFVDWGLPDGSGQPRPGAVDADFRTYGRPPLRLNALSSMLMARAWQLYATQRGGDPLMEAKSAAMVAGVLAAQDRETGRLPHYHSLNEFPDGGEAEEDEGEQADGRPWNFEHVRSATALLLLEWNADRQP